MDASLDSSSGRRSPNFELNMIPFIDLLFVTIAFLLITAVWTTNATVDATPGTGNEGEVSVAHEPMLHAFLKGDGVRFVWRQNDVVISEREVPLDDLELARAATEEWKTRGSHRVASDMKLDTAVLHVANDVPHREIIRMMDALAAPKRDLTLYGGKTVARPAFNVTLASR